MTAVTAATAVRVRRLRKAFGETTVLDSIDLDIAEGTVFALLGPNGAGKTTTVRILSTLLRADAGEALVAGYDVARESAQVRRAIGVTGQFSALDLLLTGEENLLLMGDLHHLERGAARARAGELLACFDLEVDARRMVMTYSGGMRRRLDLAMTLMGSPRIIFLDEPTTGLDPRSRRAMWQITRDLVASGVTILLTTQYLAEADQLADRIGVLDHGRLVAEGTPDELKQRVSGGRARLRFADASAAAAAALVLGGDVARDDEARVIDVPTDGTPRALRALLDTLDHNDIAVDNMTVQASDLDDVFLALTGRHDGDEPDPADGHGPEVRHHDTGTKEIPA